MSSSTTTITPSQTQVPINAQIEFLQERLPELMELLKTPQGIDLLVKFEEKHQTHQWTPVVIQDIMDF
ncbi:MAG: hypothetical protein WCP39_01480, partial [Chlamydiota bacterium]